MAEPWLRGRKTGTLDLALGVCHLKSGDGAPDLKQASEKFGLIDLRYHHLVHEYVGLSDRPDA